MPIYEYVCTACDHRADILHGINDPGPNFCPSCGLEGTMRKQFAPPAIHYKGSGWARKDRASSSSGTRATGGSSAGRSPETAPGDSSSTATPSTTDKAGSAGKPAAGAGS